MEITKVRCFCHSNCSQLTKLTKFCLLLFSIIQLNLQILLVFFSLILEFLCDQTPLPPGYYAFETASRRHGVPPRVRPPPYLPTNVPCSGKVIPSALIIPRLTNFSCRRHSKQFHVFSKGYPLWRFEQGFHS